MQTAETALEQRIKMEFAGVIPSTQTDLSRKKDRGYHNLRELDVVINQAFDRFAYDHNFHRIIAGKGKIMDIMKRIKGIYHDKIVSYELPARNFENMHLREFRAILDPRLKADDFYRRAEELEKSLIAKGKTSIPNELRYASLYSMQRKMKMERFVVERKLKEEEMEKQQAAKQSASPHVQQISGNMESLRTSLYQTVLDYIKATPELSLCIKNPESCEFIPQLKLLMGKDESTVRKLSEIFSDSQNRFYKNFICRIKETMKTKNIVLENILKREAMKSGKQFSDFKITDLSPSTWNWLASYYNSDTKVKNFVLRYREDYAKSLADLIDETYLKILRSPENFN